MFESATSFNIDVSKWNVKKVRSMANMFIGTSAFTHVWCNDDWVNSISDTDFDTIYDGNWNVIMTVVVMDQTLLSLVYRYR